MTSLQASTSLLDLDFLTGWLDDGHRRLESDMHNATIVILATLIGCASQPESTPVLSTNQGGTASLDASVDTENQTTTTDVEQTSDQATTDAGTPGSANDAASPNTGHHDVQVKETNDAPICTVATCDDGNKCTDDLCDPSGCTHKDIACDDGNPCTSDGCYEKLGCSNKPVKVGTGCDDDNACTTASLCDGVGGCAGGAAIDCDDKNVCTKDFCAPTTGQCLHQLEPDTKPCDDGDPCTVADSCTAGKCVAQGPMNCTGKDGQCATGTCQDGACVAVAKSGKCEDGDPCTTTDECVGTACVGVKLDCDDGNSCTLDKCQNGSCGHAPIFDTPCDDGNKCTAVDKCAGGTCKGSGTPCDDGVPCTIDTCSGAGVCAHKAPDYAESPCPSDPDLICDVNLNCAPPGMILIPAGDVFIGCNPAKDPTYVGGNDNACPYEYKQTKVTTAAYYIDRLEVGAQDYWNFAKNLPTSMYNVFPMGNGSPYIQNSVGNDPIIVDPGKTKKPAWAMLSFAIAYCQSKAKGKGRLPTEPEWEKAARGGCDKWPSQDCAKATAIGPLGNKPATCLDVVWWNCTPPLVNVDQTTVADTSPYGVKNMAGNALEAVASSYADPTKIEDVPGQYAAAMMKGDVKWTLNPNFDKNYWALSGVRTPVPVKTYGTVVIEGFRCAASL